MTGGEGKEAVFELEKNRGAGNIKNLLGNDYQGIVITDDYNAYKNAFKKGKHALCWSHPLRKFRYLANSKSLSKNKRNHCRKEYAHFSELYHKVSAVVDSPFDKQDRIHKIKKRLIEQRKCYFVCVLNQGIPMDNNKAERSLRHLVVKRKKAFGSRTPKGANILSILLSVSLSL